MKRFVLSPFVLPLEALVLQAVAAAGLWLVADLAYDNLPASIPHALERPAALACFALGGVAAGGLVSLGLYRLYRDHPLSRAVPVTLYSIVPLFVAALFTWGLWFLV